MTQASVLSALCAVCLRAGLAMPLMASVLTPLLPATAAAAEVAAPGEALFAHRCAPCHRDGGTGTFMLGRRLGPDRALLERRGDLVPDYVRGVVRGGLNAMPPLSRVEVPDADLAAIAAYLAKPAPR